MQRSQLRLVVLTCSTWMPSHQSVSVSRHVWRHSCATGHYQRPTRSPAAVAKSVWAVFVFCLWS